MAQNLQMNISDVLKEQTNTNRTYHAQDEKETNVGGRPRINEEEKLTKQISVYLNESEYNFLVKISRERYIKKNSFIRMLISKAMSDEQVV